MTSATLHTYLHGPDEPVSAFCLTRSLLVCRSLWRSQMQWRLRLPYFVIIIYFMPVLSSYLNSLYVFRYYCEVLCLYMPLHIFMSQAQFSCTLLQGNQQKAPSHLIILFTLHYHRTSRRWKRIEDDDCRWRETVKQETECRDVKYWWTTWRHGSTAWNVIVTRGWTKSRLVLGLQEAQLMLTNLRDAFRGSQGHETLFQS